MEVNILAFIATALFILVPTALVPRLGISSYTKRRGQYSQNYTP